jgi:hypothetical protein
VSLTRNKALAKLRNAVVAQSGSWYATPQRDTATQRRIDRWRGRLKERGVNVRFKSETSHQALTLPVKIREL